MNIIFFGKKSFTAQYLVNEIKKNNKVFFYSRKKIREKNHFVFDLLKKKPLHQNIHGLKNSYIFIFSSFVPFNESTSKWNSCKSANIYGIVNLLKQIKPPVKKIILASSCSVYGQNIKKIEEKYFLNPQNNYSLSKFEQENILRIYCYQNRIDFLCYRIGYVFGNNMNKKRLLVRLLNSQRKNKKVKLYNKNLNLNLIHTKDISKLILSTYKNASGIYNLTNKNFISLKDFNTSLYENLNYKNSKKNFISSKLYKDFPKLKNLNFKESINLFKNGN